MKKIVKPAEKCEKCGHTTRFETYEEYCDQCNRSMDSEKAYPLHLTVFVRGSEETYDAFFCSWKCARAYLITNRAKLLKTDFLSLPYPHARNRKDTKPYTGNMSQFYSEFLKMEDQ